MNYKEMYLHLFRSQTKAISLLQEAQRHTENMYIEADDTPIKLLPVSKNEENDQSSEPDNHEND